jgi:hypothetical protein
MVAAARVALPVIESQRPRTRGECLNHQIHPRPCPWVACKFHLGLNVRADGSLELPGGDVLKLDATLEEAEAFSEAAANFTISLKHTCALDVADRQDVTLQFIGAAVGVTKERIRQIESRALRGKLLGPFNEAGLRDALDD